MSDPRIRRWTDELSKALGEASYNAERLAGLAGVDVELTERLQEVSDELQALDSELYHALVGEW